jgi:hypothetical protein
VGFFFFFFFIFIFFTGPLPNIFAFGLSAKLMPTALERLFPHPPHPFS